MEFSLFQLFDKYHKGNKYTMMAHMNYNIPNNVSTNHPWYEFYTMDGKYMVDNSEQIGGDINEFQYDDNTYIFDIYKKKESDIRRVFIKSFKSKSVDIEEDNCAQLTYQTSSDTLNIESLNGLRGCIKFKSRELDKVEKQGTMLVYAIIDWARKKGFKKITLEDISEIFCKDSKIKIGYSLFLGHILQVGYPWYWKFGFRYNNEKVNENIIKYQKYLDKLKTSDILFEVLIDILMEELTSNNYIEYDMLDNKKILNEISKMTKIYIIQKEESAYLFFKEMYIQCCEIMELITYKLCESIGIKEGNRSTSSSKKMTLIL